MSSSSVAMESIQQMLSFQNHLQDFGSAIIARIKPISSTTDEGGRGGTVVCELEVGEDMLNISGFIHGGCVAYLVDVCSSLPLVPIMTDDFWAFSGVSQGLNIIYHSGARKGDILLITSTLLNVGKRLSNMRCEIRQKDTGILVASGTHSKVDVFSGKESKVSLVVGSKSRL